MATLLKLNRVEEIAQVAASRILGERLHNVTVGHALDSEGRDALRLTLVMEGDDVVEGKSALDAMLAMHDALVEEGEDRFPIVYFTNIDELAEDGDA